MSNIEDILDKNQFVFIGDFDDQVTNLLSTVRLKRGEVEDLHRLFDDLTTTLGQLWPGCQVHPFGSIVTGLGMKDSDVDCYISLPIWVKQEYGFVMRVKYILSKQHSLFCDLLAIPRAKVPIVKFYHIPTQRNCDINFKSPSGVENSRLLAYLLHLDERLIPLAVLVKFWCKNHDLTGTNRAPNYAMILLVIFYLQQLKILPSVYELQNSMPCNMVQNWNIAFNNNYNYTTNNEDSLYTLLGGFFNFYSKFNFAENIISPYLGCEVKKSEFSDLKTVSDEFHLYKYNVHMNQCQIFNINTNMCVQDPYEHSRNCAGAVYPSLFSKFTDLCEKAAKHFTENVSSEFLKLILLKDPSLAEVGVPTNKKKHKIKIGKVIPFKRKVLYKKQQRMMVKNFFMNTR